MQDYNQAQADQEIAELEAQLAEANAASNFFETASGKIAAKIATLEVNKILNEIASDKFLKDHPGYVNALAQLQARRDWLKRIQIAASPIRKRKIEEKLDERK